MQGGAAIRLVRRQRACLRKSRALSRVCAPASQRAGLPRAGTGIARLACRPFQTAAPTPRAARADPGSQGGITLAVRRCAACSKLEEGRCPDLSRPSAPTPRRDQNGRPRLRPHSIMHRRAGRAGQLGPAPARPPRWRGWRPQRWSPSFWQARRGRCLFRRARAAFRQKLGAGLNADCVHRFRPRT